MLESQKLRFLSLELSSMMVCKIFETSSEMSDDDAANSFMDFFSSPCGMCDCDVIETGGFGRLMNDLGKLGGSMVVS